MSRSKCPRCGSRNLENYSTHSYCIECNFNSVEGHGYEPEHETYKTVMTNLSSLKKDLKKILKEITEGLNELKANGIY